MASVRDAAPARRRGVPMDADERKAIEMKIYKITKRDCPHWARVQAIVTCLSRLEKLWLDVNIQVNFARYSKDYVDENGVRIRESIREV